MSSKKKHFIDPTDPTKQFISNFSENDDTQDALVAPKPVTNAFKVESSGTITLLRPEGRTRRLQLVLRPSIYDRAKDVATKSKISLNEFCHIAIEKLLSELNQEGGNQ